MTPLASTRQFGMETRAARSAGCLFPLKNALRSGAINFPMWGSDTGGYIRVPSKELFARWLEFSALSPMMEVLIGPKRTVWYDYDPETRRTSPRRYTQLHHDLIPYTRSYLYHATQTGMPVMRSLTSPIPTTRTCTTRGTNISTAETCWLRPCDGRTQRAGSVYLPAGHG